MKKSCKQLFLVVVFFAITLSSYAQTPPPPPPPVGLPIDGGIVSLILAGLFYGAIKLIRK